jgi:hypothetical protein
MPRVCTICIHDQRLAIDQALITQEPIRKIAARFGTSPSALTRHKAEHLPVELVKAQEAQEAAQAGDLLTDVRGLYAKAVAILQASQDAGALAVALGGIREARGCLELLAKLQGQLDERPVVNVLIMPEWQRIRAVIIEALADEPGARIKVATALRTIDVS